MGKKYIIELERGTHIFVLGPEGITHIGEPDVVYEAVDGMQIGDAVINAEPYTEPDLEQVRKEEYDRGYDDAKGGYENGFENGMIVAWEAARKICTNWVLPDSVLSEIFGMDKTIDDIMKENTASEAIEKIRAYEQGKEEIKVGDEVELKCGVRPAIYMQGTKGSDEIYLLFNDGSCGLHSKSEIERKTGRHFHEIATILENMRGEQDG